MGTGERIPRVTARKTLAAMKATVADLLKAWTESQTVFTGGGWGKRLPEDSINENSGAWEILAAKMETIESDARALAAFARAQMERLRPTYAYWVEGEGHVGTASDVASVVSDAQYGAPGVDHVSLIGATGKLIRVTLRSRAETRQVDAQGYPSLDHMVLEFGMATDAGMRTIDRARYYVDLYA